MQNANQSKTQSRLKIEFIVKRECTTESKLELKWIAIEENAKQSWWQRSAMRKSKLKVNSNSSRGRALPLPNQHPGLPAKLLPFSEKEAVF